MIIFLAGLRQIPQDLYEAASHGRRLRAARQFWKITLPLLTPVIFFNLVLQTIEAFKAFTPAFIISGGTGGPIDSTLFYTLYLYQEAFAQLPHGLCLGARLGAARDHRDLHRHRLPDRRATGCTMKNDEAASLPGAGAAGGLLGSDSVLPRRC